MPILKFYYAKIHNSQSETRYLIQFQFEKTLNATPISIQIKTIPVNFSHVFEQKYKFTY